MNITFKRFAGSIPRLASHLLGEDKASYALDCRLWHGRLESWREPKFIEDVPEGEHTYYLYDDCFENALFFPNRPCVSVAEGPVGCRKVFTTGDKPYPAVVDVQQLGHLSRRLGVLCGGVAPSVVLSGASQPKDAEGRSYAYQYVNGYEEAGALSKASMATLAQDGQTAVVSGWAIPDASWGITKVRIYRSVSGYQKGNESSNEPNSAWMLVGDVGVMAPAFSDSKWNQDLSIAMETDVSDPPPAELQGIAHIAATNSLVGFVGNKLYFSENNSYHHWPYILALDDNIRAIAESNGDLYVATDGNPYIVKADVECKNAGCREVLRLPVTYPMAAYGNRHMAALPQGAAYPSHNGLVLLSGASLPLVLTHPLYAPDDWQVLQPNTIVPVAHEGRLYVFGRGGSFVLQIPNGPEQGWPLDSHSSLSDTQVRDAQVTRQGRLLLQYPTAIKEWNRGSQLRPHKWVSPEWVTPNPVNFSAGHLYQEQGSEHILLSFDSKIALDRDMLSNKVFRVPMWASGTRWQVTLSGTASVSLLSLASSMHELGA